MKKLLLVLLCLPFIGFGQSWEYSSGGNDFDGTYRTASVIGTGDDYPYNSPMLVVNYFDKTDKINFYINNAGYFTSNSSTSVKFIFSNEKDKIYNSSSVSISKDNKIIFLDDFFLNNTVNKLEMFKKLMDASYVSVRIENDYGKNDMKFSLSGSTKSIKYVINDFETQYLQHKNELNKQRLITIESENKALSDILELTNKLKFFQISKEDKVELVKDFVRNSKYYDFKLSDIDTIKIQRTMLSQDKPLSDYFTITLSDSNALELYKFEYEQIPSLLSSYKIEEEEEDSDDEFFMTVEEMPEFPGGDFGLMKYILKNINYPTIAKEYNITGKVYVSYIVDKTGTVTNVKVIRGVDKNLDEEAVRLVKSLPNYKPGKNKGRPARVMFTIPINFTLN